MKINDTTLEVTRSGSFKEKTFTIQASPKMFAILSSGMYTDIEEAVVRELSTNASDSHTEAGCPEKPFDVHLPNTLEPWLRIRDYGTGISPENMETIYSSYSSSTRSGSDDFTGCLGLGSKSPFGYTDQFTAVSFWNGVKYTYSVFKNENSCPCLALLGESETNEPNGLEIHMSIKPGDIGKFVQTAQKVYAFFKVRPNIVGAKLHFDNTAPIFSNDKYALYDRFNGETGVKVVMGQVCYDVSSSKINSKFGYYSCVLLHMPIGSCSIATSREELQYDDRTIANVNAALKDTIEHVKAEVVKGVANETCTLDKLCAMKKYSSVIDNLSFIDMSEIVAQEPDKYAVRRLMIRRIDKLFIEGVYSISGGHQPYVFIEEDVQLTQNFKSRIRQFMKTKQTNNFYIATVKDAARFKELFGDKLVKLSSLPDVPRAPRKPREIARAQPIKLMSKNHHDNLSLEWGEASTIDTTDACCVPREGNWVIWNGNKVKPNDVRRVATAVGFKKIYGIAAKRYDSLIVKYGLQDLSANAKAHAEKKIANLNEFELANMQHGTHNSYRIRVKELAGLSPECDNLINTHKATVNDAEVYSYLCNMFKLTLPVVTNHEKKFFEKYPILLAIDWYSGNMKMSDVIKYVKMVESQIQQ